MYVCMYNMYVDDLIDCVAGSVIDITEGEKTHTSCSTLLISIEAKEMVRK